MIINNTKTLFTYYGESLDLMNPPDISNIDLYTSYYNFLNNTILIYGSSRSDGTIPIFWTKINDNDRLTRSPDHSSTLKQLENNKSYYIIVSSNSSFPLGVPSPINFLKLSCEKNRGSCNTTIPQNISVCSDTIKASGDYTNIILTDEPLKNITMVLSELKPDTKYNYSISTIASSWPAKISPLTGFIERSGPSNEKNELTANLEFLFTYVTENNDQKNINKTLNNFQNDNHFTILDIKIFKENCDFIPVFQDSIYIECQDCLQDLVSSPGACPQIHFNNNQIIRTSPKASKIILTYNNIDVTQDNYFYIQANDANWPAKISSLSGLIIPEYIYTNVDNGKNYGSGTLSLDFEFSDIATPDPTWPNLNYILDTNYTEKYIPDNIYCILHGSITTPNSCLSAETTTTIFCDECLKEDEYKCINMASLNIFESTISYPNSLDTSRPGAEKSIPIQCCDQDRHIIVNISGICPNEIYDYKFEMIPDTDKIMPVSGLFSSPTNAASISTIVNLDNYEAVNLQCSITHRDTNRSITDSIILRCEYCRWSNIKNLKEIFNPTLHNNSTIVNYAASNHDGSVMVVAIPSGYIYRSTDYGINWDQLNQHDAKIWSAVTYSDPVWYVSTGDSEVAQSLNGSLYKSVDNLNSLTLIENAGEGVFTELASSNNGLQILVSSDYDALKQSIDGGINWNNLSLPLQMWNNISIAKNANTKIVLSYVNTSGAYFISSDSGTTWQNTRVPFISGTHSIMKYSANGNILSSVSATGLGYIYMSYDDGESWYPQKYTSSTNSNQVNDFYLSDNGKNIMILANNGQLFHSKDYGENWYMSILGNSSTSLLTTAHSDQLNIATVVAKEINNQYSLYLYNCPSDLT